MGGSKDKLEAPPDKRQRSATRAAQMSMSARKLMQKQKAEREKAKKQSNKQRQQAQRAAQSIMAGRNRGKR